MKEYVVIYEQGKAGQENWGAYVPDLPGCISTGKTFEEVQRNIKEAIELHIEGMKADGEPIPEPTTRAASVGVAA
ncbi:MAG TPA: type II toxin-antitoxin system HicB family antitoxin [Chthonomonadaceae bacterium]|nr:type II toxin-antitoxin system HicB family antitoxin [Chthonomonadaceae bacterium]